MIRATREEVGCLDYSFAVDLIDPDVMRIAERWVDPAALDEHFSIPRVAAFNRTLSNAGITGVSVRAHGASGIQRLIGAD